MNPELLSILEYLEREKGISRDTILEAIESSLITASKKSVGREKNLSVSIDKTTGDIKVFAEVEVVEEQTDSPIKISYDEARQMDKTVKVGDTMKIEVTPENFGRIAAQTAKQVIIQKLREAEKNMIYNEFKNRVETLITGVIRRYEHGTVVVDLGKTEGFLPQKEQVDDEKYPIGSRISAFIIDVRESAKGPEIILSRTHPGLVTKLFELEIPEIAEGTVLIKSVAREPGHRTKIAVASTDEKIDCVGACVGMRGARVKNIVRELSGEKIDIIRWHEDIAKFVEEALSPAKPKKTEIDKSNKSITVIVEDSQLSLAIGKKGQNARLTSKLVGWNIDIVSASRAEKMEKEEEFLNKVSRIPGIGQKIARHLIKAGYDSVEELSKATIDDLKQIEGLGEKSATKLLGIIRKDTEEQVE